MKSAAFMRDSSNIYKHMKQILSISLALAFVLTGCITKSPVSLTPIPTNPEMAQLERQLTARMNMPPLPPMPTVSRKLTALKAAPGPVFYDPFNSGIATPWTFYTGTHQFTTGILRLNAVSGNGAYAYVKTNWTNVSVSADIKLGAGSWGGAVGLRYNPTNGASYQAWVYGSGRFAIKKYNNWFNTSTELVWVPITAPGTTINNVKLSVVNNVLTAYLNNTLLLSYTDTSSPFTNGGGIALTTWGGNGASSVDFDNVTVYDLSQTLAPAIVSGLSSDLGIQGQTKTLSVTATGAGLTYIWRTPSGVTTVGTNTYTISNLQEAGVYSVTVTNASGADFSTAFLAMGTTNILSDCLPKPLKTSVTLAWCPSPSTTNNVVAGYRIYYGSTNPPVVGWRGDLYDTNVPPCPSVLLLPGTNWYHTYTNMMDVGNVTNATVTNLVSGPTYYFSCTAYDTNGLESDYSGEVSFTVPIPLPPSPPTNVPLSINIFGQGKIQLQAKVCPSTLTTILYQKNFGQPWNVLATNVTADAYGNFSYVDTMTDTMRFYRALLQ